MKQALQEYLANSYTAYHACDNAKAFLLENGFTLLKETEDWDLSEGGKYFVERNGSALIAFCIGGLDNFSYKITASHLDSPALKLKENAVMEGDGYATLNMESYGGGIWYSFFDRPLKIAGRMIFCENGTLRAQTVASDFNVTIPSVAVHMNREVNDSFAVKVQTDMRPLFALSENGVDCLSAIANGNTPVSYDLYLVNADTPYSFGLNDEFLASPRIDNLTSAYASLMALVSHANSDGICVAALLDNEEVGSGTLQGAGSDFLENVLRRIAYALRFDDNEYYEALASSFLLSVDNAHARHPNHPEKSDPTNKTLLGGGVVIKAHANRAYTTDAVSSAVVKTILDKAGVKRQSFFNHSNLRSGGTLGAISLSHVGVMSADIGIAQLAMHSACESFAYSDYVEMVNGLTAFYSSDIAMENGSVTIR